MIEKSKKLCDYIEAVQEAIVFSYTSVEAFVNLCIPEDYEYKIEKSKGRFELYDSYAIQRNINLKDKIKNIVCKIYKLDNIITEKFWDDLWKLEQSRNDIIHLKNKDYKTMIQKYLNPKIFDYIKSANQLIKYVILNCERRESAIGNEHLWPIIDNKILTLYASKFNLEPVDYEIISADL